MAGDVLTELDAAWKAKTKPAGKGLGLDPKKLGIGGAIPPGATSQPSVPEKPSARFETKPGDFTPGQLAREGARRIPGGFVKSTVAGVVDAFNTFMLHETGKRAILPGPALTSRGVPDDATMVEATKIIMDRLLPPESPELGASEGVIQQAGEGVGSGLGFLVPGAALTKAPRLVQVLALAGQGAALELGSTYNEALAKGATEEQAWQAGILSGAIGGPTELVGIGGILGQINRRSGGGLARALLGMAQTGVEEAGQEVGQEAIGDVIAKNVYDEERVILADWLRTGSAAGLSGAFLSALVSALPGKGSARQAMQEQAPGALPGAEGQAAVEPLSGSGGGEAQVQESLHAGAGGAEIATLPPMDSNAAGGARRLTYEENAARLAEDNEDDDGPGVEFEITEPSPESDILDDEDDAAPPPPDDTGRQEPTGADIGDVSIKNRMTEARLADKGLPPPDERERLTFEQANEEAAALLEKDPLAGVRLMEDLRANKRAPTPVEDLLLDRELVRLENRRDALQKSINEAAESGDTGLVNSLRDEVKKADDEYLAAVNTTTAAGTESSYSLSFRRAVLKRDYSLARIEQKMRAAKAGEDLTDDERAQAVADSEKIKDLEKKLDEQAEAARKREADLQAELATERMRKRAARPRKEKPTAGPVLQFITARADEARKRIKERGTRMYSGFNPAAYADEIIVGAEIIAKDIAAFADWSKAMIAELGEGIRPRLADIFDKSKEAFRSFSIEAGVDDVKAKLRARIDDGDEIGDLRVYVRKVAEAVVNAGTAETVAVIDATHQALTDVLPDLTRDQVRDIIGGRGEFKPLSKTPAKVRMRQIRGEIQQILKMEALLEKRPLEKIGPERRVPDATERSLQKIVADLKKKYGVNVTDPDTQLKGVLDSIKTRLRNQIEDLQRQIDTKVQTIRTKGPSPRDAEVEALETQRDALQAQYDEVFAPIGPEPRQDVLRLQNQVDELTRKIAEGDIATRGKKQGPELEAVANLKAQRAALQKQIAELRKTEKPKPTAEEVLAVRVMRATRALETQIEDYGNRLADADTGTKAKGTPVSTPEIEALRARRDALAQQLADLRSAQKPTRSKEEAELQALKSRMTGELATLTEADYINEPVYKAKKKERVLDEEALAIQAELEAARRANDARIERIRRKNRTKFQKAVGFGMDAIRAHRDAFTAFDLPPIFRQGSFIAINPFNWISHPKKMSDVVGTAFKAIVSEKVVERVDTMLHDKKYWPLADKYQQAGGEFTRLDAKLSEAEEGMQSRFAQWLRPVRASGRGYMTLVNLSRAFLFEKLHNAIDATPAEDVAFANLSNVATGRGKFQGKIGDFDMATLNQALEPASVALFSPRRYISRLQMLLLQPLWRGNARTRLAISKEIAGYLTGVAAIQTLMQMAGADEPETDPTSSDFGKVRFGPYRLDMLDGLAQFATLLARTFTGETVPTSGESAGNVVPLRNQLTPRTDEQVGYGRDRLDDTWKRFGRSKQAPAMAAITDVVLGEHATMIRDAKGKLVPEPVTPRSMFEHYLNPISWQGTADLMEGAGVPKGLAFQVLNLLGMGLQNYDDKKATK